MKPLYTILTLLLLAVATSASAQYPERAAHAKAQGRQMTVKEWKTTPDGKNKWVDHIEIYNAKGQLVEEREYSDYGRSLSWRSEYFYNDKGQLEKEIVYNERNKPSKVRKFEYDSSGRCTRRLNYSANGILNSYRQFEFIYE